MSIWQIIGAIALIGFVLGIYAIMIRDLGWRAGLAGVAFSVGGTAFIVAGAVLLAGETP